ncbi:hypothetical protein D918_03470 [Trichuris suis]|nr:hypothetical protein D918_03470 [Trichuris suis]
MIGLADFTRSCSINHAVVQQRSFVNNQMVECSSKRLIFLMNEKKWRK